MTNTKLNYFWILKFLLCKIKDLIFYIILIFQSRNQHFYMRLRQEKSKSKLKREKEDVWIYIDNPPIQLLYKKTIILIIIIFLI